jgi:hypothetical protein
VTLKPHRNTRVGFLDRIPLRIIILMIYVCRVLSYFPAPIRTFVGKTIFYPIKHLRNVTF